MTRLERAAREGVAWLIAAGAVALIVLWISAVVGILTPDRLEEDQPGWDCATMGNQSCGVLP